MIVEFKGALVHECRLDPVTRSTGFQFWSSRFWTEAWNRRRSADGPEFSLGDVFDLPEDEGDGSLLFDGALAAGGSDVDEMSLVEWRRLGAAPGLVNVGGEGQSGFELPRKVGNEAL